MISASDRREFRAFLRNATDRQVQGIYDKEARAGRDAYAELAVEEADRRSIYLEREDHARKKSPAQLQREIDEALTASVRHGDRWISQKEATARAAFDPKLYEKAVAEGRIPPAVATRIAKATRAHATKAGGSEAWDVILDGRVIDTVFYTRGMDADEVRRSLINHDGYDARIEVRKPRRKPSAHATKIAAQPRLVDAIHAGSRVTIVDRFGKQHTGRAVMRGSHGWVLNMGGRHGTPGIATDANVIAVTG